MLVLGCLRRPASLFPVVIVAVVCAADDRLIHVDVLGRRVDNVARGGVFHRCVQTLGAGQLVAANILSLFLNLMLWPLMRRCWVI